MRTTTLLVRVTLEKIEVVAQLPHRAIEIPDVPMRTCLHDTPLHRREDEFGQSSTVHALVEPVAGIIQAALDCGNPRLEVLRHCVAHRRIRFVNFKRKAADWTSIY